ncbi:hypothetical protein [Lactiplantibacillus plantarum]|nr:hypothetical protein [Lactiplantibacillus plantarum]MCH8625161.1 hypothetical protein [Lactiplantibacillus plantarum]MCH8630883.1 hypothetical protein [Lactiplantibacillus plantarum]MCH8633936.1 hypothetical protein [Lactiplantibacillus plantarum]
MRTFKLMTGLSGGATLLSLALMPPSGVSGRTRNSKQQFDDSFVWLCCG